MILAIDNFRVYLHQAFCGLASICFCQPSQMEIKKKKKKMRIIIILYVRDFFVRRPLCTAGKQRSYLYTRVSRG